VEEEARGREVDLGKGGGSGKKKRGKSTREGYGER